MRAATKAACPELIISDNAGRTEAHPLRLIAAFPNPQNPKLGAVAYRRCVLFPA